MLTVSLECWLALAQWRDREWFAKSLFMGLVLRRMALVTDSPLMGWGAICKEEAVQGVLELLTVYLVLKHVSLRLTGGHVMVSSDNTLTL